MTRNAAVPIGAGGPDRLTVPLVSNHQPQPVFWRLRCSLIRMHG